ncbi:Heat shock factor protein 4 [Verticillium dahliae VDG1]|nr:Heat shock factor protein 4 [Verticillium dahliae VDG1]
MHTEIDGEAIARALHGRTLHVPSMRGIFEHWPQTVRNTHYLALVEFVNELITQMLSIPSRVAQHKSQDLALFCALWYPHVDWETLKTLSYYTIWLFLWDDTIDTAEYDLADDLEEANRYRQETVASFNQYMRSPVSSADCAIDSVNGAVKLFGRDVASFFTEETTERFLHEVDVFITCSGLEQEHRISGKILEYDEYIDLRLGTTAVYTLTGLVEFIIGEHLPQHIMNSQARRDVWREANIAIIIVNDILSLKKELRTMCLINAVSALMKEGMDLQGSVDELLVRLVDSVARFDAAASVLDRATEQSPMLNMTVRRYCDACRTMVTATYEFSLVSARYMLPEFVAPDGSVHIPL